MKFKAGDLVTIEQDWFYAGMVGRVIDVRANGFPNDVYVRDRSIQVPANVIFEYLVNISSLTCSNNERWIVGSSLTSRAASV